MKLLPLVALFSVILLGSLFVFVVEDIPAFGDPYSPPNRYIELFSIDAEGLESSLDAGVVPAELRTKIEEIGYTKENAFPSLEEGKYEIESNDEEGGWDVLILKEELYYPGLEKFYFIKEEDGKLKVYRYSIPVRWQEKCEEEMTTPNMVTAGLADYRGYDTLGETTVIYTAAISVILLLRRRGKL
ncbi:MAG TPA: hydrogen gas-evolving membrane-bound hydrogenase subunit E [Candidatus Bathyarchaeia archaeon]|nr:hydrogen gas-evolving membrane-bound hydrogenase subunit E [Candidatus Bathyarchaeia archaeon]